MESLGLKKFFNLCKENEIKLKMIDYSDRPTIFRMDYRGVKMDIDIAICRNLTKKQFKYILKELKRRYVNNNNYEIN